MAIFAAFFCGGAALGTSSTAGQVFVWARAHGFVQKRRRRSDELMRARPEITSGRVRVRGAAQMPADNLLAACKTLAGLQLFVGQGAQLSRASSDRRDT
jgi:hypothetical protein